MCIRDRGRTIQRIADETGVAIMTTPVDTYAAGKLISQCAPISYYLSLIHILCASFGIGCSPLWVRFIYLPIGPMPQTTGHGCQLHFNTTGPGGKGGRHLFLDSAPKIVYP